MLPDNPIPGVPPEVNREPVKFFAFASKAMIRGELVEFYVDRAGRITSDKLEFDSATPRLGLEPMDHG